MQHILSYHLIYVACVQQSQAHGTYRRWLLTVRRVKESRSFRRKIKYYRNGHISFFAPHMRIVSWLPFNIFTMGEIIGEKKAPICFISCFNLPNKIKGRKSRKKTDTNMVQYAWMKF